MRIIDKNTDFYDFYQNIYIDKTFTFDRRDSYLLTKEIICNCIIPHRYYSWRDKQYKNKEKYYLLLQVCNTFWLFKLIITKFNYDYDEPEDYNVELLARWRNFNKERKLIALDLIDFHTHFYDVKDRAIKIEDLVDSIDNNNYKLIKSFNKHIIYIGGFNEMKERHIPILKASGLASLIDPHEIFLAIEEYFSLEKSESERRDPIGITDIDRIESHGFDKKTSFRGKV